MRAIRRKTRETLRHERAVVLQQLGTPPAAAVQQDIAANLRRADELRAYAIQAGYRKVKGGGHHEPRLGLVTKTVAGGNGAICSYCLVLDGHNGNCPEISLKHITPGEDRMSKTKTIAAVLAGTLAVIGLLFTIPNKAGAIGGDGRAPAAPRPLAKKATVTDYGSGIYTGTTSPVVRTGDPATADYTFLGDSILVRCTSKVQAAMTAKGKTVATIGQSSQNTKGLVDLLLATPAIGGKVVMEAGTNSVFNPPEVAAQIARAQTWAADNGIELFWGDTYVGRPSTINADLRNSGWVNSFIYSAIPYDHIIKWQPAISAAVGRGGMDMIEYYIQDGVHPWASSGTGHGDGCAFFAAVYVAGLGL